MKVNTLAKQISTYLHKLGERAALLAEMPPPDFLSFHMERNKHIPHHSLVHGTL
jgi:hypothetical protein